MNGYEVLIGWYKQEKIEVLREKLSCCHFVHDSPIWAGVVWNLGLCGERQVPMCQPWHCLGHGE